MGIFSKAHYVKIDTVQYNHLKLASMYLAESEFQNSNVGGKKLKICVCAGFEISTTVLRHEYNFF